MWWIVFSLNSGVWIALSLVWIDSLCLRLSAGSKVLLSDLRQGKSFVCFHFVQDFFWNKKMNARNEKLKCPIQKTWIWRALIPSDSFTSPLTRWTHFHRPCQFWWNRWQAGSLGCSPYDAGTPATDTISCLPNGLWWEHTASQEKKEKMESNGVLVLLVSVSTFPFPLLSREGNWKEKGIGFCFGTKDLPARRFRSLWKANAACVGVLIAKLGYLCHGRGRRFEL